MKVGEKRKTFTKINKSSRKQVLPAYTLLGHVKKWSKLQRTHHIFNLVENWGHYLCTEAFTVANLNILDWPHLVQFECWENAFRAFKCNINTVQHSTSQATTKTRTRTYFRLRGSNKWITIRRKYCLVLSLKRVLFLTSKVFAFLLKKSFKLDEKMASHNVQH